jgi:prophage regulatory protein
MTGEEDRALVVVGGVDDRLLPWGRVRDIAGISRSTAWRLQRSGDFPKPVQLSPGRVGWWESELTAWKVARGSGVAFKSRTPPSRPRLPGMPRRMPGRPAEERVIEEKRVVQAGSEQPVADVRQASPVEPGEGQPVRKGRGRAGVSPGQIDFGF